MSTIYLGFIILILIQLLSYDLPIYGIESHEWLFYGFSEY